MLPSDSLGPEQDTRQNGITSDIMENPYLTATTQAAQEEMLRETIASRRQFYNMSIVDKTRAQQNRCARLGVSELHREDRRQLAEGLADLMTAKSSISKSSTHVNEERVAGDLLPPSFRPMRREGAKSFLNRQKEIARVRMTISMNEREIDRLQKLIARREEKLETDEIDLNRLEISLENCTRSSDTGVVETTRQAELASHKLEICKRRLDELSTALQTILREIDRQADLLELNLTTRQFLEDVAAGSILRSRVHTIQAERATAEQEIAEAVKEERERHTKHTNSLKQSTSVAANSPPDPFELLKTKKTLKASLEFCAIRASLLAAAGLDANKLYEHNYDSDVEVSQGLISRSILSETNRRRRERQKRQEGSKRHLQVDFDFGEFQAALCDGLPKELFTHDGPLIEELQRAHLEELKQISELNITTSESGQRNAHLDAVSRIDAGPDMTIEDVSLTNGLVPTESAGAISETNDLENEEYLKSVKVFETLPVEHFPTDPSVKRAVLLLRRSCTNAHMAFDDATELMDALKRLEDANLLRAEQLQDYTSIVASVQTDNAIRAAEFARQQATLRATIASMENSIAELKRTLEMEMASSAETEVDRLESELGYLHKAVSLAGIRTGAIGADDINMAPHSILGAMELLLDRTLASLAQIPVDRFQEGRRKLNKMRRDISKVAKQAEQDRIQAERNAKIALRAEKNTQARAPGRTVQFRSYGGQEKRMTRAQRELAARLSREDKTTGDNCDFYSRGL